MKLVRMLSTTAVTLAVAVGGAVSVAPSAQAVTKGTCSISVNVWTNDADEIISDATANCSGAKDVKVRSRLYYCSWYEGSSRHYVVKKSKTNSYNTLTGKKKVTVVDKSMFGRWYAEGYVWYKKDGITYSKSDLEFASVGSKPSGSAC